MKTINIKGVIPAFISPFNSDGSLNKKATQEHARRLIDKGADSLYVGGSTGEMILMSNEERMELLEAVMEVIPENYPIIAHVGAANPADAYELAKHAEKVNAAAISSVTPFYYKYTFGEIKHYYEKIASIVSVPMVIYNIPTLSGASLSLSQLFELLNIENVCGIKFTSSDYFTFERIRRAFPDKLLYNGSDEMFCSGLAMGADGGIGTTYNVMVDKFVQIYKLFKANRTQDALEVQHNVNDVIGELFKYSLLPAVKALVRMCGCDCGNCRDPFSVLSQEEEKALAKAVSGKLSWDI